ncbi:MAG: ATPase [Lachnospiraceae bacterium]|nr:ATPase [Lachnospiraceae bacterium]
MIEKMQFISITGPSDDIDRMTETYLSKYEIQLESALSELKTTDNLRPFLDINPYRESLNRANAFVHLLPNKKRYTPDESLDLDDMFAFIRKLGEHYEDCQTQKTDFKNKIDALKIKKHNLSPFKDLDVDLGQIHAFHFIAYRFGKIPIAYFARLEKYLLDDMATVFYEETRDEQFVYGAYFAPPKESAKVTSTLNALHFETIELPIEYSGIASEVYQNLEAQIQALSKQMDDLDQEMQTDLEAHAPQIIGTRNRLEELANHFDIRKLAAQMDDKKEDNYYVLCGWMTTKDVNDFCHDVKDDHKVFVVVEENTDAFFSTPPTKLKNPKIFKPFELFIEMYGMPAANEMDPTIWVGLSYPIIFGVMFGDVGQGLVLFLAGSLLYFSKKIKLAGIVAIAGISSTFFGFMFGSFFGFEDVIHPIWMRPINAMSEIPFFGKLNTIFIIAVAFGMGVIILSMIVHIINGVRSKDAGSVLIDANGITGLVFYGTAIASILLFMTGNPLPAGIILAVMFGIPFLLMFLKEPLLRLIHKKPKLFEGGIAMFFVQGFFEMFEVLLSYFSNTISFVRIGAFAVSHAAMMQVVLMLAGAEQGNINWIVIVVGNIIVIGMEGLIVGIQVLRLEFNEVFSRFYKGTGKAFTPYIKQK